MSEWKNQYTRMEACRVQGHPAAYWVRREVSNGSLHLQYWCDACGRAVTKECYGTGPSVTVEWVRRELKLEPSSFPLHRTDIRFTLCMRCLQTTTCEQHHIAPRAVFEDADDWPVVPLCRGCHDRWTQGFEAYVQRRIRQAKGAA